MMLHKTRILFPLLFYLTMYYTTAQEIGSPFIRNYEPSIYNGEAQIWASTQSKNGIIYIAGYENIHSYNGKSWSSIHIKDRAPIRSIDSDDYGRVYLGSKGELGYLKASSSGDMKFQSLLPLIDPSNRKFSDVWHTCCTKEGVFFATPEKLFNYNPQTNTVKTRVMENELIMMFYVHNRLFLTFRKFGIRELVNNKIVEIKNSDKLNELLIWSILPYEKDKLLIATPDKGLFVFDSNAQKDSTLTKFRFFHKEAIELTDKYLTENQIYYGIALTNETYAFATILNGIVLINKKGEITRKINKNNGLANNTVHHLKKGKNGLLWASTAFGLSKIEIGSPFSYWDEKAGLMGIVYTVARSNNHIYAATNIGTFLLQDSYFLPVKGLTGINAIQCFDLVSFKKNDDNEEQLTTVINGGIYHITGLNSKAINNKETYQLFPAYSDSSKHFFLENDKLFSLKRDKGSWITSKILYTFNSEPQIIHQCKHKNIWAIQDDKAIILKPNLNGTYDELKIITDTAKFTDIVSIDGKVYLLSGTNTYLAKDNGDSNLDSNLFGGILTQLNSEITKLKQVSPDLYILSFLKNGKNRIGLIKNLNGIFNIDTTKFSRLPQFDQFIVDGTDNLWVISPDKLIKTSLTDTTVYQTHTMTLISSVRLNTGKILASTFQNFTFTDEIDFKENNLIFEFTSPFFIEEEALEYSYRLEGDQKLNKWSIWTKENKKEFTNIPEGEYTFMVKSRNIFGVKSQIAYFSFTILPPWYRTKYAKLGIFIVIIMLIAALAKLYTRRLLKEKEKLEKIIQQRTAKIIQQKEEIESQSENLKKANSLLIEQNEEIGQQKEEMQLIFDNLQDAYQSITFMNEKLAKANEEISIKNEKITDSIQYAKRIQLAVLPPESFLSENFSEHFILFKPKDIVSGDFYWYRKIKNKILLAVADGTGHGVPGALISIMGITYLQEISEKGYQLKANEVLNKLRKEVKNALGNNIEEIKSHDGMDIAFCIYDPQTLELQYSGAHHHLYIFNNSQLKILSGDRMAIGTQRKERTFSNHSVKIQKGDILYVFSDGFVDQFGGWNGRKYLIKNFRNLLKKIHHHPLSKQRELLEQEYENWKGDLDQIDDILIMGLRI